METSSPGAEGSSSPDLTQGNHFSCSLTATLLARVRRVAGEEAVPRLLRAASSRRTVEYLVDIGNWVSYNEAIALWEAGTAITQDPEFARHVGEDTVRVLGSSSTATVLRSLGSPEKLIEQMAVATRRFSTVNNLETLEARPGYAEIRAEAVEGFPRHPRHCDWTSGLLTQTTALFGLTPATIEHQPGQCQALGADACLYRLRWQTGAEHEVDPDEQIDSLKKQLAALSERLENVFATASDLIASGDLDDTLARITDRAAQQVRAPRYLLAVRSTPGSELHCHQRGFDKTEGRRLAEHILSDDSAEHPDHWLVAPVSSHRSNYGTIVAMYEPGSHFFPHERQLLEVYARYAATALDSATALREAQAGRQEAQRRLEESRGLLDLARQLATAASSEQIARRLANAVPAVVDCDCAGVYLWDEASKELVLCAVYSNGGDVDVGLRSIRAEDLPRLAQWLAKPDPEPYYLDLESSEVHEALIEPGEVATVAVPIATEERFLGVVAVSVRKHQERLRPSPELGDRLSGVAAHAVTALLNGRLVDHNTYQASHDQLTGVANRVGFSERLAAATERAHQAQNALALFYLDLDGFKPINDEFGHEVGDGLLRAVAGRLEARVRPSDTVARLGGDEFAVLVEKVDVENQLSLLTQRLEDAFDQPFEVDGHTLSLRASIGRAVWPIDTAESDALLRRADGAMYEIKRGRRSTSGGTGVRA
jgi:diguanylate cyclase (GGDEF)-like protein